MKTDWSYEDIGFAVETLQNGGTILYPTDTIWGIGGDATNQDVVNKILEIKRRPAEKSMLVLVYGEVCTNFKEVKNWLSGDQAIIETGLRLMQEATVPTTIIFPQAKGIAKNLLPPNGSIGMRYPNDPFCLEMLKRFGKPIISTSANLSGHQSSGLFSGISDEIKSGVDYVVKWRQDDEQAAQASRVLRIKEDGTVERLR